MSILTNWIEFSFMTASKYYRSGLEIEYVVVVFVILVVILFNKLLSKSTAFIGFDGN